jgi:hypothetical protein
MNKKEFKTKVFGIIVDYVHDDLFKTDNCVKSIDEFWNWINQNYISKQQILNLECLKEEECPDDKLDNEYVTEWYRGRNQLRNEIKEEIKKL